MGKKKFNTWSKTEPIKDCFILLRNKNKTHFKRQE